MERWTIVNEIEHPNAYIDGHEAGSEKPRWIVFESERDAREYGLANGRMGDKLVKIKFEVME